MEIERGVPIPKQRNHGDLTSGLLTLMEIGNSILIAKENTKTGYQLVRVYKTRHPGWNYVSRLYGDGSRRVWRVA
jgi:hypothetical protein